ncbi:MAG TPA: sigma-70 family RNA polymerase sigma factor [Solirubrobacteraceae bacterium]|nr:sigma-70 family RNA polymerase sigma factor [Solirubrobacteraceae bacterium]
MTTPSPRQAFEPLSETTNSNQLLLPADLELRLRPTMTRFCAEHGLTLIVDARHRDRRHGDQRREERWPSHSEDDVDPPLQRRRIRNVDGRRVGERRATFVPVAIPGSLPRRAGPYAERIVCVERIGLSAEHQEDWDTARLVTRYQAGEREVFSDIYLRYFDRLYGYLRMALRDSHEAEDATQQVFLQMMEALPNYELRSSPFRAWLFRIVRNYSINHLVKHRRVDVEDPMELDRRRENIQDIDPAVLEWLTDKDLMILVGRLPLAQRQVIMLKYMLDLSAPEIAGVLGRSPDAIRQLQQRAMTYLRDRLGALGRGPGSEERPAPLPMRRLLAPVTVLGTRRAALGHRLLPAA